MILTELSPCIVTFYHQPSHFTSHVAELYPSFPPSQVRVWTMWLLLPARDIDWSSVSFRLHILQMSFSEQIWMIFLKNLYRHEIKWNEPRNSSCTFYRVMYYVRRNSIVVFPHTSSIANIYCWIIMYESQGQRLARSDEECKMRKQQKMSRWQLSRTLVFNKSQRGWGEEKDGVFHVITKMMGGETRTL